MNFPTLFELLRPEHLKCFNDQKKLYPAIADNLQNALTQKYNVGTLTLNDCTNICCMMSISYLFTYTTIHDLFYSYKIVDDKIVIDE